MSLAGGLGVGGSRDLGLGLRLDVGWDRDTGYLALSARLESEGGQSTTVVTMLHYLRTEVQSSVRGGGTKVQVTECWKERETNCCRDGEDK